MRITNLKRLEKGVLTSGRTLLFTSLSTESGSVSFRRGPCRCAVWRGDGEGWGEEETRKRKKGPRIKDPFDVL